MIINRLKFKVLGYTTKTQTKDNKKIKFTQLQTYQIVNEKIKRYTLKINKLIKEEELTALINKVIYVDNNDNLQEFGDFDKVYMADSYKIINEEIEDNKVLEIKKEMDIVISTTKINEDKNNTAIQYISNDNNNIQLFNITLKDMKIDLSKYINSKCKIKDLIISNFNGKTYYSSKTKPTILDSKKEDKK